MRETGLDNLGVNFDPANLMMSGRANSLDALRMFRGCLYGVHAKDGRYPDVANGKVSRVSWRPVRGTTRASLAAPCWQWKYDKEIPPDSA